MSRNQTTSNPKQLLRNGFSTFRQVLFLLVFLASLVGPLNITPAQAATSTVNLEASADTYMNSGTTKGKYNYGGATTIQANPYYKGGGDYQWRGLLLKWDLSNVPSNATVSAASITFYVTDSSAYSYNLYNLRRSWTEGTNDGEEGTGASWNYYGAGSGSWSSAGAQNTSNDRYNTNLWDATASTFGSIDIVTIPLNASGISVVQGWINGTTNNYGLTIQNYSGSAGDPWVVASRENTSYAGPTLNVTYDAPAAITTSGTLSAFSALTGMASAAQTYTVSGNGLTADISITAPTGFQVSTSGTGGWGSSLTLSPTGGTVTATTVYVRLYSAAEGTFSGNITHTSTGVTEVDVAASGTVSNCGTASLEASADNYISEANDTNNYGASTTLKSTRDADYLRGALLQWNLDDIPSNVTVSSASLTLYVSKAASTTYNLYSMRQSWLEGTGASAESEDGATWPTYDGTNTWGSPGAQSTSADRYDTNLWGAGDTSFSSTGSVAVNLNTEGIAAVQGWLNGTLTNNGLTIQNYSTSTSIGDDLQFASSESTSNAGPTLNVSYCLSTDPFIMASGTLSAFSALTGVASDPQSYTVAGSNLDEPITITAPAGFQVSTSGTGGWDSDLTLSPTGGTLASTPIYVRLYSTANGDFRGNITHASTGAAAKNVAVSGSVSNEVCTTVFLEASEDTYMSSVNTGYNYGGVNLLKVSSYSNTDRGALIKWDLGSLPDDITISEASLTLYVSTSSSQAYNLYNLRRSWVEGTLTTGADSSTSVNWDTYDGSNTWATGGAASTASDRYDTNLWGAGASSFSSTGSKTVSLNSAGLAVVQGWIDGSVTNYGLTMQNYSAATSSNDLQISSSESTSNAGPTLNLTYCVIANQPPAAPGLVQPADAAAGVSTSPSLQVSVADPEAETMDVSFYGRAASTTAPAEDFTLVVIPDTQNYASSTYASVYTNHIKWIADHKTANNIVFATGVGDTVNYPTDAQYAYADTAYDTLDAGGVPYSVGAGNHDMMSTSSVWPNYFGESRYTGKSYYGDSYDDYNHYFLFSASGNDFILINLQYNPGSEALDWADELLKTYSDRRGIVEEHDILDVDNSWENQASYTALKDNPNLFLMVCGHMHASGDGAAYRSETGDDGHTIHIVMQDYQDFDGSGYLRLYRFSPANDLIYMTTYSPISGYSPSTITTDPDQMNLAYDMAGEVGDPFKLLGTADDVPSGSTASFTWSGLDASSGYEWYAVTSDGTSSTTGDTWSFTTGAAANQPPVITEGESTGVTVSEDSSPTAFDLTLHATDVDTAAGSLTWSIGTAASNGTATASGTGASKAIIYAPDADFNGADSFTVQVSDGSATDSITVNVTVQAVNDAPVVSDIPGQTIAEGETLATLSLDGYVADVDNTDNTLAWTASGASQLTISIVNRVATITAPSADWNGSETITFRAADPGGLSAEDTASFQVTSVNDAPVANDLSVMVIEDTPEDITLTAADVDGDALDYEIVAGPSHGTLSLSGATATYTPAGNYNGADSFTFKANDGELDSNIATVSIEVTDGTVPGLPSSFYGWIHISDNAPVEGDLVEAYVTGASAPVADALISASSEPELVYAINVPGDQSGTTAKDGGAEGDIVTFKINGRIVATGTWHTGTNVRLNFHPPQALAGGSYTGQEGTAIAFSGSAVDDGSDATTYQWDWDNDGDYDETAQNTSRTFVEGSYTVGLKVTDAQGGEGAATTTVAVINAAPALSAIGNQTAAELVQLAFTASASDPDGVTYSLAAGASGSVPEGAAINAASGAFSWTPTEDQGPANYTFDVCASDGLLETCETITVEVSEVNLAPVLAAIGNKSVNELAALTFIASATDGDEPANTFTYFLEDAPTGAAIDSATGAFSWTPTEAHGPDNYTFTVKVCDGASPALCDEEEMTVSVAEVNTDPVLQQIENYDVDEGSLLTFTALASDADLPANTLTFDLQYAPSGASIDPATGVFTWTPTEAQGPGEYIFDVVVFDGKAYTGRALGVTVDEVNAPPVANAQSVGTAEDTAKAITLTGSDPESSPLTFSIATQPAHGTLSLEDEVATYTPAANYNGPDSFTFKANDGTDYSAAAAITINVTSVNDLPAANAQTVNTNEDTAKAITLTGSDVETSALTFTVLSQPEHGALSGDAPSLTYTPAADFNGSDSFTFKVSDGELESAAATVSINVASVNDAPVASDQPVTVVEDTARTITLAATDVENDTLTYTIVAAPQHGTLTGDGPDVTYTPAAGYNGPDSFTFKANDGVDDSNEATVSITVTAEDDPPVADAQTVSTDEDTAKAITLTGSDPEGSTLTFAIVTQPANGALSLAGAVATYTPAANFNGSDSFTFKVNDGNADSAAATVTINVTSVNDIPVANAQSVETNEDTPKAITLTGSDIETASLDFEIVDQPANGTLSLAGAIATYSPAANFNGSDSFTFRANDGTANSAAATVTINVAAVNDAPVANAQTAAATEDTAEPITLTGSDPEGSALTFTVVGQPEHGSLSGTAPDVTYTPAANFNGPDSFTFKAGDGTDESAAATVTIAVASVNDAPAATAQSVTVIEDTPEAITLAGTDADGDSLTFALGTPPVNGVAVLEGSVVTYTPEPGYSGPDSFTFTASDGQAASAPAEVSITISEVNDAPTADDQTATTPEDTAKPITLTGSDPDGDPLTFSIVAQPANGTVSLAGAVATYTPARDFNGPDSFTFRANDGTANSAAAAVTINVTSVNDIPVLDPIGVQSVVEGSTLSFTAAAEDADLPDDELTFSLEGAPSGATIAAETGLFSWTPSAEGEYTFDVCVTDEAAAGDCQTVVVTVTSSTQTTSIDLLAGWNLISFRLHPADTSIAGVLASLSGSYDLVYAWDASGAHAGSGNWVKYIPGASDYVNTLKTLDETMGFWIHLTAAGTLEITGTAPTSTSIALYDNAGGWNLVGYPAGAQGTLPAVLSDHGAGDFTLIYAYHLSDTSDPWKLYDQNASAWANDLKQLDPGWGYWIYVTADSTWSVDDATP